MKSIALCLVLAVAMGTAAAEPSSKKEDFVFVGTVLSIKLIDAPDETHNFEVSCSVDKVLSGQFSGDAVTFAVHSPAKARLEFGGVYEIKARWTGSGYRASEWEIHRQGKDRRKRAK